MVFVCAVLAGVLIGPYCISAGFYTGAKAYAWLDRRFCSRRGFHWINRLPVFVGTGLVVLVYLVVVARLVPALLGLDFGARNPPPDLRPGALGYLSAEFWAFFAGTAMTVLIRPVRRRVEHFWTVLGGFLPAPLLRWLQSFFQSGSPVADPQQSPLYQRYQRGEFHPFEQQVCEVLQSPVGVVADQSLVDSFIELQQFRYLSWQRKLAFHEAFLEARFLVLIRHRLKPGRAVTRKDLFALGNTFTLAEDEDCLNWGPFLQRAYVVLAGKEVLALLQPDDWLLVLTPFERRVRLPVDFRTRSLGP